MLAVMTTVGGIVASACGTDDGGGARVSCASPAPKPTEATFDAKGQIVFSSDRAGGNLELFVMNADGSGVRRLTTTPASETVPVWSPDGTEIAFVSFEEDLGSLDADASPGQVKIMRADGSGMRTLTSPEPQTGALTWSPDGERIAFASRRNIDVMRADGTQRRVLAELQGDENWPSWSPDGDLILVTSSGLGPDHLSTIRADGSDSTPLPQRGFEGMWSPDGRSIAFASDRDGDPDARDPVDWNEEIYVTTADGSRVTRITRIPGNDHWPPAWSPDGTHIAFTSDGCTNKGEIFIADAGGTGKVWNASNNPAHDFFPSWHR
jgi:Tol biopolymer transport system component